MAAEHINLAASSRLSSASTAQAQHNRATQKNEAASAKPEPARNTAQSANASATPSPTQVTISQRAKDMAAQRQSSDNRHENQRVQEQQAVQQMSLLNGELRRAYGT